MKVFSPAFRDDQDKITVLLVVLASLFFTCFPALIIVLFLKDKVSENSYAIIKALFNFELVLFLALLLLTFIPVISWLVNIAVLIFNVIVILQNVFAIAKNSEIKFPSWFEFI